MRKPRRTAGLFCLQGVRFAWQTLMGMRKLAMIARWKPLHLGHARILRCLLRSCQFLEIGIGSSNRYDAQNPFTALESQEMIELALGPSPQSYRIHHFPDLGHGPRWAAAVQAQLGELDALVTANGYVRDCLKPYYAIVHPLEFLPAEERVAVDGTMVRSAMLQARPWEHLVLPEVADYILARGLVERLRSEFAP